MATLIVAVVVALVTGLLFSNDLVLTVVIVVAAVAAWFLIQRAPKGFAPGQIEESPVSRFLFSSGEGSIIWLPVRIALGWAWVQAGWEKLQSPGWMAGGQLAGFWAGALKSATGAHPSVGFEWYAGFLQGLVSSGAQTWFAPFIAVAEFAVGVGLILGLFTGIAAVGAAVMNLNYMLAGSAGVNPLYFVLGMFLVLAWRNAGWIGLDRFLLPALGTPWQPQPAKQKAEAAAD